MINLTKVKSNSRFNTLILSAKTMIWYKLIGFNENYSWATYQLQNYAISWRYEWDRNEYSQSRPLLVLLQKKRRRDRWSSTIFINTIALEIQCSEDIEKMSFQGEQRDSRVSVFCKKKKNIHYPWVYWSRSRDMWFGRYRWSCRFKIWYQIFADHCEYIIVREIHVKKYSETNFINIMRYYQCKIQYLSPTCQKDLPSNVVTSVSLTKSEGEFTQEKWFIKLSQSFIGWNRKDLEIE